MKEVEEVQLNRGKETENDISNDAISNNDISNDDISNDAAYVLVTDYVISK